MHTPEDMLICIMWACLYSCRHSEDEDLPWGRRGRTDMGGRGHASVSALLWEGMLGELGEGRGGSSLGKEDRMEGAWEKEGEAGRGRQAHC